MYMKSFPFLSRTDMQTADSDGRENREEPSSTDCADDLRLLLDCLHYHHGSGHHGSPQRQALTTIAAMCTNDSIARDHMRTSGALKFVLEMVYSVPVHSTLQTALMVLGCAAEKNVVNQSKLCEPRLFSLLSTLLSSPDSALTLLHSAAYLLGCLMAGNGKGQNLARESSVLNALISLFKSLLPSVVTHLGEGGDHVTCGGSDSVTCASGEGVEVWKSVVSALCTATNNPQNEQNQRVCSGVFPAAMSLLSPSLIHTHHTRTVQSALGVITSCVASNATVQSRFRMVGGLHCLVSALRKNIELSSDEESNEDIRNLGVHLVQCISASAFSHTSNSSLLRSLGTVPLLVSLLRTPSLSPSSLTSLTLCLGMLIEDSIAAQKQVVECGGLPMLVSNMAEYKDEELSKAATFVLQCCFQNKPDNQQTEGEEHVAAAVASLDHWLEPTKQLEQPHNASHSANVSRTHDACSNLSQTALETLDKKKLPVTTQVTSWLHSSQYSPTGNVNTTTTTTTDTEWLPRLQLLQKLLDGMDLSSLQRADSNNVKGDTSSTRILPQAELDVKKVESVIAQESEPTVDARKYCLAEQAVGVGDGEHSVQNVPVNVPVEEEEQRDTGVVDGEDMCRTACDVDTEKSITECKVQETEAANDVIQNHTAADQVASQDECAEIRRSNQFHEREVHVQESVDRSKHVWRIKEELEASQLGLRCVLADSTQRQPIPHHQVTEKKDDLRDKKDSSVTTTVTPSQEEISMKYLQNTATTSPTLCVQKTATTSCVLRSESVLMECTATKLNHDHEVWTEDVRDGSVHKSSNVETRRNVGWVKMTSNDKNQSSKSLAKTDSGTTTEMNGSGKSKKVVSSKIKNVPSRVLAGTPLPDDTKVSQNSTDHRSVTSGIPQTTHPSLCTPPRTDPLKTPSTTARSNFRYSCAITAAQLSPCHVDQLRSSEINNSFHKKQQTRTIEEDQAELKVDKADCKLRCKDFTDDPTYKGSILIKGYTQSTSSSSHQPCSDRVRPHVSPNTIHSLLSTTKPSPQLLSQSLHPLSSVQSTSCAHYCLACRPRFKCRLITSRNFLKILLVDKFTCPYHHRLRSRIGNRRYFTEHHRSACRSENLNETISSVRNVEEKCRETGNAEDVQRVATDSIQEDSSNMGHINTEYNCLYTQANRDSELHHSLSLRDTSVQHSASSMSTVSDASDETYVPSSDQSSLSMELHTPPSSVGTSVRDNGDDLNSDVEDGCSDGAPISDKGSVTTHKRKGTTGSSVTVSSMSSASRATVKLSHDGKKNAAMLPSTQYGITAVLQPQTTRVVSQEHIQTPLSIRPHSMLAAVLKQRDQSRFLSSRDPTSSSMVKSANTKDGSQDHGNHITDLTCYEISSRKYQSSSRDVDRKRNGKEVFVGKGMPDTERKHQLQGQNRPLKPVKKYQLSHAPCQRKPLAQVNAGHVSQRPLPKKRRNVLGATSSVFNYSTPAKTDGKVFQPVGKANQKKERTSRSREEERDKENTMKYPHHYRPATPFSRSEVANLLEGVKQMGHRWKHILVAYSFHPTRTAVSLKDKYRNVTQRRS